MRPQVRPPTPESADPRAGPVTPVVLVILDGVGCAPDAPDNAVARAHKPNWDRLWASNPHTTIDASELRVGLPPGQMGNSEVGHLNIGAGRVVYQEFTRIDKAIHDGEFDQNPALVEAIDLAREGGGTLHVLGLLSPGGVHSHERHMAAMVALARKRGAPRLRLHAFLDGRDTPPRSAAASVDFIARALAGYPQAGIAGIVGRYYAMDRDKRWERVQAAWDLIVDGAAAFHADTARDALALAYARGENDEFVAPTVVGEPSRIEDGDVLVFMNFRADRARELTRALTDPSFDGFARSRVPRLASFVCLTSYGEEFAGLATAFPAQSVANGFGQYVSDLGLAQLRIAETEKYAHVTYFFNGGVETPYPREERRLVPSPRVATYDLKPEMSAVELTDALVAAIDSGRYDAIVCNYANGDMVGHTGNFEATTRAIETLDACIGRVVEAQRRRAGEVLITADHGNAEMMHDSATAQAHTAHTCNHVPLLYVGRRAQAAGAGALQDVAPTLLAMMRLPQPPEMTGRSLLVFDEA